MDGIMSEIPTELRRLIDAEEEKDKKLVQFADDRNAVMVAVVASWVPRRVSPTEMEYAYVGISEEFGVETILTLIQQHVAGKDIPLYLLINSRGGSVSSSYKTAKAIRSSFSDITVFVPHVALSGGTLLALTGNRICLGKMSHLSPLDVQTEYKDTNVSVNALFRAKGKLDSYFEDKSEDEVPYTMKVMAEKIDAVIMEDWTGEQETMLQYVEEILRASKYRNYEKIAKDLIYAYPSHGYVIDYAQAKKLGLKVLPDSKDPQAWNMMRYWLGKYVAKATDRHFIRCIIPSSLKAQKTKKEYQSLDRLERPEGR